VLDVPESAATEHLRHADEIERGFLSCGFHDRSRFYDAVVSHSITAEHFTNENHAELFACLIAHAQLDVEPTVERVRFLTEKRGVVWSLGGDRANEMTRRVVFAEGSSALTERYVELLVEAQWRRERARELIRNARELMSDDLWVCRKPDLQCDGVVVRMMGARRSA
jgi:hypothetical protein